MDAFRLENLARLLGTRIVLIVLSALLALPVAQTASPVEAKNRSRTVTRTISNAASIFLPYGSDSGPVAATVFPSTIMVGGLKGKVRDVNVHLNDLDLPSVGAVRVLLVGPRGQTAVVLADVGRDTYVNDVTLRLDDEAEEPLPDAAGLQSGAFRPTNAAGSAVAFLSEAPQTTGSAALSAFDGSNPNGTWRLFVQKQIQDNPGYISGGWELEIQTRVKAKNKKKR
jgi:subtilisin-like proprotein convertase family protein